jgi:hypothetical protein
VRRHWINISVDHLPSAVVESADARVRSRIRAAQDEIGISVILGRRVYGLPLAHGIAPTIMETPSATRKAMMMVATSRIIAASTL